MTAHYHGDTHSPRWLTTGKDVLDVIKSARDAWPIVITAAVYAGGRLAHLWQALSPLETALSLAVILLVLSGIVLLRRTNRYSALLFEAERRLRAIEDFETEQARRRDASDSGLPALPNPAIQHNLAIWAVRFSTDPGPAKPILTVALLGINYGDDEVTIMKVAIPNFCIAASSNSPELRTELVRDEMVHIAAGQHFQFFVTRRLDTDLLREFDKLSREVEYAASFSIEAHCRRHNNLFSYANGTFVRGVIARREDSAITNADLALMALSSGAAGPNVQRLIENGDWTRLRDLLAAARATVKAIGQAGFSVAGDV